MSIRYIHVVDIVYFLHVGRGGVVKIVLHAKVNTNQRSPISICFLKILPFLLASMHKPQVTAGSNCTWDIVYPCKKLSIIGGTHTSSFSSINQKVKILATLLQQHFLNLFDKINNHAILKCHYMNNGHVLRSQTNVCNNYSDCTPKITIQMSGFPPPFS